jgi:hypothetical protein
MATYETGTATGPADLVGKLVTFAQSLGWTVSTTTTSNNTVWPAGSSSGRVFSKGSLVFGVGWATDDLFIVGATAVNGSNPWNTQTGTSSTSGTAYGGRSTGMTGPYQAYHFFAGTSPDYIHIVVETTAGIFRHTHLGELSKAGTFTGGAYAAGTSWFMGLGSGSLYYSGVPNSTYHQVPFDASNQSYAGAAWILRADIDGKTNNWVRQPTDVRGAIQRVGNPGTLTESLHERSPSEFNQLTPFVPLYLSVLRSASLYSPIGYPADLRFVNVTNFAPGEVVTLGSDQWMVFPIIAKTATWGNVSATNVPSSGTYGFAYKRN